MNVDSICHLKRKMGQNAKLLNLVNKIIYLLKIDFRTYFYIKTLLYIPLFLIPLNLMETIIIFFFIIVQLLPENNHRMARD